MEELLLILKYAFLGTLQGITEPIPVSSSGHLVIFQELFNIGSDKDNMSFEIFMNFASLLAVLLVFRKEIIDLAIQFFSFIFYKKEENKSSFKFVIYLVIATIPAGVFGILFEDVIAATFSDLVFLGIALFITGIALFLIRNLKGRKGGNELTLKDAIIVGLAQSVALIPGISRSGATLVAALGLGMKRETAFFFSFMLYIPISLGTTILSVDEFHFGELLIPNIVAFICSFVFSYISLLWFKGIVERGNLKYFAYYCLIVGTLLVIFL